MDERRESVTELPPASPPGRPPRTPKPPRPPRPPRRLPSSMLPPAPLSPTMILVRGFVAMIAILLLGFSVNLLVLSHLQHAVAQQNLFNTFRIELADATAPVSEGTVHDTLVADGAPVALIDIPSIGLREIVVEGTSSGTLTAGPGHRRDTVLPGQAGMSVIMGRAAAYGGPFSRLAELAPGETFQVTTGQGEHVYEVVGLRYAGDPTLPSPKAGEGRLMLQTARGPAYIPTGVEYVDARLVTPAEPAGRRQTTFVALPPSNLAMATDTSTVWALAFALQLLIAAEVAAVWSYRRFGARKIWIVFVPVFVLSGLWVADQVTRLLPNLL